VFKDKWDTGETVDYENRTVAVRDGERRVCPYYSTGRTICCRLSNGLLVFTIFIDDAPFGIKSMGW
jgi:hypothetical protein